MSLAFLERLAARTTSRNRFPIVRRGYSPNEVDVFIDEIERGVEVSDSTLYNQMFTVVQSGYDRPEVHRYLASLAKEPIHEERFAA